MNFPLSMDSLFPLKVAFIDTFEGRIVAAMQSEEREGGQFNPSMASVRTG